MARETDVSQYNLSRLLEGEGNHQISIALQRWLDGFPTNYWVNSHMAKLFGWFKLTSNTPLDKVLVDILYQAQTNSNGQEPYDYTKNKAFLTLKNEFLNNDFQARVVVQAFSAGTRDILSMFPQLLALINSIRYQTCDSNTSITPSILQVIQSIRYTRPP